MSPHSFTELIVSEFAKSVHRPLVERVPNAFYPLSTNESVRYVLGRLIDAGLLVAM